jgi:multidrug efflux pump subunit AcrB
MNQTVTFDVGTDIDVDNVLVNNRYSQAQPFLPQDVKNFGVTIKKSLAFPLMVVSLYSPDGRYDPTFLANYALININDALLRIKGVGDIRNLGAADYSMRIWIKPDLLARLGLTVNDLQNAVRAQNVVNPAGQVGAEPAPAGQQLTYTVRAQGRLVDPEEFGNVIVRENPDGSNVRLKDVARIELGALTYQQYGTFNGRPAAVVAAFQSPGSNALDVADNIRKTMADLATRFPPRSTYQVSLDTTAPVKAGMREIVQTLVAAVVLVALVVFLFLQSWRATLIPLLTVPVSLIGAFAVFPVLGFSVNTLSLFGLVLAIGLVVDDAIVVVEAVEHHIEEGMSPRDATFRAMSEVTGPVVAIALILAAVFVPVAFMSGVTGRLYQQFALTIAVSVLISAFNALTLSPALSAMLLRPRGQPRGVFGRLGSAFNRSFGRATDGYVAINRRLVRKVAIPLFLLAGVVAVSVALGRKIPAGFVRTRIRGTPSSGCSSRTGLAATNEGGLRDDRRHHREAAGDPHVQRRRGLQLLHAHRGQLPRHGVRRPSAVGRSQIARADVDPDREQPQREVRRHPRGARLRRGPTVDSRHQLHRRLQHDDSGPRRLPVRVPRAERGSLRGRGAHAARARGDPPHLFAGGPAALRRRRQGQGDDAGRGDRRRLCRPADLSRRRVPQRLHAFRAPMEGVFAGRARLPNQSRRRRPVLRAKWQRRHGSALVVRQRALDDGTRVHRTVQLYRSVEIQGTPAPGYSSGQALDALEEVARKILPPDMGYAFNALSYQEKISAGGTARVLGLSLVFVFLILAALYESWSLPFSVLLSTPVAVLGAYLGLVSRHFDNNIYAQIGLVMLVG